MHFIRFNYFQKILNKKKKIINYFYYQVYKNYPEN